MMPCRLVISTTMLVTRSDLLSSAARGVTSTSAGVAPSMLGHCGASCLSRSTRSSIEPSLAWKVSVARRGVIALQRAARVLAIEVGGIGIAGADHAFVALAHDLGVGQLVAVGHGHEVVEQLAVLDHREIALVLLHHADQHRRRQLQVVRLKGAQQRLRRLDQIGDLVEQRRLVGRLAADAGRRRGDHCFRHQLAALAAVHDDALGRHGVKVASASAIGKVVKPPAGSLAAASAKRGPRLVRPLATPAQVKGTTWSP